MMANYDHDDISSKTLSPQDFIVAAFSGFCHTPNKDFWRTIPPQFPFYKPEQSFIIYNKWMGVSLM